ncbi:MAG: EamA family transporter [Alphaproteobacteria bacterium]|nr:EamA family transporter [Alphaproteobacteria bacterium]
MTLRHVLLAILVTFLWGSNFIFIKLGLNTSPPLFLGFMRFAAVGLLAFFIPRPKIAWSILIALGFFMFFAQFSLTFVSMKLGLPTGLTSVIIQSQVIFTIAFISIIERKLPSRGTIIGICIALIGLWCIGDSVAGDKEITLVEFSLVLIAAMCWGVGNLLMGRLGQVDMVATITWMALVSTPFFAAISLVFEGPTLIWQSVLNFNWTTALSVLFISYISTSISYTGWGWLIRNYGASAVSPYSLLVPITGVISAALILDEVFDALRASGIALILVGLAVLSVLRYREAKAIKS